ncbi:dnaJ homolog subfamily B member 13-like isoform X2 [Stegodyphus dumicola]|uniref:dnaJ homolog subfamily B member 13-like isoform X2 n=1 Tax=Stegodyphus dumicola TaxID=202533 RepID=UPI0015AC3023|nr:dnaJ homolog subfamily B member 13-like isoform X2 [Stegodyphus dumicola]
MGLDYYSLLEITRNANDEDIKEAYRKLALKYHPKRSDDPKASERFEAIGEAYDVLTTPKWKALYDQFGEESIKTGVPVPPEIDQAEGPIEIYTYHGDSVKVFRDFFGVDNPFADYYLPNLDPSYQFFEEPAKPIQGPDQEHSFSLSLEDAFYGCTKTISLPIQVAGENGAKTITVTKDFTFRVPKDYC